MKYFVVWPQATLQKLAALYLDAKEHSLANAVTKCMAQIEHLLEADPLGFGESRDGLERILFEPPLIVSYEVHEDVPCVVVFDLRLNIPKT